MTVTGAPSFRGDERFQIRRELGRGGMGIVYEAYDLLRDETVALKALRWIDADGVYRFKKEFRTLADVAHRNLIQLYELVAHGDNWFFTMELVEGVSFLKHVRPAAGAPLQDSDASGVAPLHVPRLRAALRQLVEGVAALHRAGKVHRDIKPSNVLVTNTGRVVILDFGIAAESVLETVEKDIVGTAEYMSPEQCAEEHSTPASDWYAVGVLLYEALTGSLPFTGSLLSILTHKLTVDPPPPSDRAPGLPPDLVDLSVRLLARTPAERPADADVLQRVGASASPVVVDRHAQLGTEGSFTGRAAELAALEDAFATVEHGSVVSFSVHGRSGIGKTTLIRHFTDELVRTGRAVVLAGRCYLREAMPYKALDGVVDMLTRLLNTLPDKAVERSLPKDIGALSRVFPVLRRVKVVDQLVSTSSEIPNERELRRRAFTALHELLAAISRERPVVIHIDDLQWTDHDSADLLDDLLRRMARFRLLVILSFRSEEVSNVPLLESLLASADAVDRRQLEVGPLAAVDAVALAQRLLEAALPNAREYAQRVAQESDGNPFLIDQISRFALSEQGLRSGALGLEEMIDARTRQMPKGGRGLVEVLAVAGQPTNARVAYHAAGLSGDERPLVTSMRIAHLLRADSTGERIELYHDRIREHYAQQLSPAATRRVHLRLAQSLEAKGIDDPEAPYEHYRGAGELQRAAGYAAQAAQIAQAALAFERAAQFYQRALECSTDPNAVPAAWYAGLGDALAGAGRGGEAAKAYLQAVERADVRDAIELERRAGEQLLISGRIHEGIEVMGRVLLRVGLRLPRSSRQALVSLILRRLRLRMRGLRFRERNADQIPAEQLTRIDACWAVAEGLALINPVQAAAFQSLHLRLALESGEPNRIALGLAFEGGFAGSSGAYAEADRLLDEAERLARRLGSQHALGLCALLRGTVAYHTGQLQRAAEFTRKAEAILSEQVAWHLSTAKVYRISILFEMGEVAELCRLTRVYLEEALNQGNVLTTTMFLTGWSSLVWLTADDVAGARTALERGVAQFHKGDFQIPHFNCMLAQGLIDLYEGDHEAAYRHLAETWPRFKRSLLTRITTIRIHAVQLQARCALAAACAGYKRDPLLRFSERMAGRIAAQKMPSREANEAKAHLLRAGIAATRGHAAAAVDHLTAAITGFERRGMALWHAVAKRRKGELAGGDEGDALLAAADVWLTGEGITNPERITAVFAPGFPSGDP